MKNNFLNVKSVVEYIFVSKLIQNNIELSLFISSATTAYPSPPHPGIYKTTNAWILEID